MLTVQSSPDTVYQGCSAEWQLTIDDDRVTNIEAAEASFVLFRDFGSPNVVKKTHFDGITLTELTAKILVDPADMEIDPGLYRPQLWIRTEGYEQIFLLSERVQVLKTQDDDL